MNYEADILIIGTGIAGMSAAVYAAEAGFSVNIITKGDVLIDSNTYYAQGGIIYKGENDSVENLIQDIINAGAHLSLHRSAKIVAEEGPHYIQDLLINKAKINFTKNKGGKLDLTEEAAHSARRIIHSSDATGKAIAEGLFKLIKNHKKIKIFKEHLSIDLILKHHHTNEILSIYEKPEVLGSYILALKTEQIHTFTAKVTILAAGGVGQIYNYTTNSLSATGDGIAIAYRAGASLINMEYTQFHPTALYQQRPNMFLISEMVRGEGGRLKDLDNQEFMQYYHSQKSLAPRDIVARAIHEEMLKKHLPYVFLDIHSYMKKEDIKKKFPTIYKTCLENNINITNQPIPVVPAFHFLCGGVKVNENGKTNLNRLFAIGEVSCTGIHGANRLASTSLLEGLVWAGRSIHYITNNSQKYNYTKKFEILKMKFNNNTNYETDPACIKQDWNILKNIMWNYVGLIRSSRRLNRALNELKNLRNTVDDFYQNNIVNKEVIELKNAVQTAIFIAWSALQNKTSRGAHYRVD